MLSAPWFDAAVPVDAVDAEVADEIGNQLARVAPKLEQSAVQRVVEFREAAIQPPAAGRAGAPDTRSVVVMDEHGKYTRAAFCGRVQGGVIGKTQIRAKPNKRWRCHRHIITIMRL